MDNDQKRAFLAVALSAVVLFGWQAYFGPPEESAPVVTEKTQEAAQTPKTQTNNQVVSGTFVDEAPPQDVQTFNLSNGEHALTLNSKLQVLNFKNPNSFLSFQETTQSSENVTFEVKSDNSNWTTLLLNLSQTNPHQIEGRDPRLNISYRANLAEDGKFNFIFNSPVAYRYRIVLTSKETDGDRLKRRRFLYFTNDLQDTDVGSDDDSQGKLKWLGLDYNYHLLAVIFSEKQSSLFRISENGTFRTTFSDPKNTIEGSILFTKKEYDHLTSMGDNLNKSIDFGFFGILAVPLLRALQYIYKYIPNYGIAIILLTLIIRLLTFPLQFKSFKSMKKMQKVQPEMQKLREKYKDDPQRMQQETMALFKRAGANPLGGCLPMVMQMPIFFAFYQLLANSVELVGAPFAFHIVDLSASDPYYVLPVLMGITMFAQMKLNPSTTADPTQQKVMMFMPIIFTFFMKDLPAGMNLYFCCSNFFGVAQQLFVYKAIDD